ncbi:hypothetical protein MDA_GLEAN10004463 [Myotis davidii]|uniref:Uncharacterized protein n=1 Tax=Myotis davidii TaxID=225400 RepID=L5LRR9_MYODS|nr:hypothetical protein MDA_GLEAN10004463 [Myotis davidii]
MAGRGESRPHSTYLALHEFVHLERSCGPRICGGHRGEARHIFCDPIQPLLLQPLVPFLLAASLLPPPLPHTDGASPIRTRSWRRVIGASASSGCKRGQHCQWVEMAAAAPIAPQEKGKMEKPSEEIGAISRRSHPLMALSDWDWHQVLAVGMSGNSGTGCSCELGWHWQ